MARNNLVLHRSLLFVLLFDLFCQVVSDYCGNDQYCQSPYKCCANSMACCYDHSRNSYLHGFKLHVWNMWYFWLVVIFIMMSCFGGCGYYRRQRLAALQQSAAASTPSVPHRVCVTRQMRPTPRSGLYAYTGPGADTGSTVALPPPYTEVMQQPNLYPVNKVDLPPYPGPPADKDTSQVSGAEEVGPPPYCEVAMPSVQPVEAVAASCRPTQHVAVPSVQPVEAVAANCRPTQHVAVPSVQPVEAVAANCRPTQHVAVPLESVNHSGQGSGVASGVGPTQASGHS